MEKLKIGDLVLVKVYPNVILFSPKNFDPIPTDKYVAWGYKKIDDFFALISQEDKSIAIDAIEKNPVNGLFLDKKEYSMHKHHHTYNILLFYKILVTKKEKGPMPLWFPAEDVLFNSQ